MEGAGHADGPCGEPLRAVSSWFLRRCPDGSSADDAEQPQDDDDEQDGAHDPKSEHADFLCGADIGTPIAQCACQPPKRRVAAHVAPRLDGRRKVAGPTGFEPAISSVTGWHVGPLHHGPAVVTVAEHSTVNRRLQTPSPDRSRRTRDAAATLKLDRTGAHYRAEWPVRAPCHARRQCSIGPSSG